MASLSVFCVVAELGQWLTALSERYGLLVLVFRAEEPRVQFVRGTVDSAVIAGAFQIFLGKELPVPLAEIRGMSDVNQRGWGMVNVRGGGLRTSDRETRLVITELHGEDLAEVPFKPGAYIKWLKTSLKKAGAIKSGVVSCYETNLSVAQGTPRDVYYTDGALSVYRQGVKWRPLDPQSRSCYLPVSQ